MKKKRDTVIVVLSHMDWSSGCDYVKQTSIALAEKMKVIVFNPLHFPSFARLVFNQKFFKQEIQPLPSADNNLHYIRSFGVIPLQRIKIINSINRLVNLVLFKKYLKYKYHDKNIIFWVFHHSLLPALAYLKDESMLIYDRPDQIASIDKKENKILKCKEKELIVRSDHVFANSPLSFRYVKKLNKNAHKTPWGCNPTIFTNSSKEHKKNEVFKKIKRPRLGFVAPLNFRIDYKILHQLAKRNPNWNFVLVGGESDKDTKQNEISYVDRWIKKLKTLPNIYTLGHLKKEEMPDTIDQLDIGLVLYDIKQEYNLGSNPIKVYEYLAGGKPVVSTPIEAMLSHQPYVKIGKNVQEFEKHIKYLLANGRLKRKQYYKNIAKKNSWQARIKYISNNILNDIH
jgi:glycosyltransferase involved in cell wall biosynthesis